jgi:hypothetical protein
MCLGSRVECRREKELNDFQRNPLDIEILSNLRFGSLEIRDTSVTRVTNNFPFAFFFAAILFFNRSHVTSDTHQC